MAGDSPFAVIVERTPDYVRFNVSGQTSLQRFSQLIETIAADIDRRECCRIMVDLRQVQGRLATLEQQRVGELAAAGLPQAVFRLASVVPEGEVSRNSEAAAVRAGLLLRVFDSEAAALFWLLEGERDQA